MHTARILPALDRLLPQVRPITRSRQPIPPPTTTAADSLRFSGVFFVLFDRHFSSVAAPPTAANAAAMADTSSRSQTPSPMQKQFAPLKGRTAEGFIPPTPPSTGHHHHLNVLRGVVFDVDGTLCIPQTYMFGQMREALGITKATDILDHIYSLPTPEQQHEAMEKIRSIERAAMASQEAQPGLAPLMDYLAARGVRKAICTRNFEQPVMHLLGKFLNGHVFEPIVTREFRPAKPDPAGILHIARSWGLLRPSAADGSATPSRASGSLLKTAAVAAAAAAAAPSSSSETPASDSSEEDTADRAEVLAELKEEEAAERAASAVSLSAMAAPTPPVREADASGLIMVGDSIDDMTAGRKAGAATVLLVNDVNKHLAEHEYTDLVITQLDDLIDVLENGFAGRQIMHSS